MTKVTGNIPSLIYGAGAEDVNHEIYGGLYDQRLFGESFEEPARMGVENFTSYDSPWAIDGDALVLSTTSHGKIVYQGAQVQKGTVSVDMRIDSPNAISGFIIHVTGAAAGADSFSGYEIGINAATSRLVVGKHQNNWQPITEVPVDYKAGDWNNIALHIDGATVEIALNGTTVYTLRDTSSPLVSGLVGLRSYGGSARFSHLSIDGTEVALAASPSGVDGFLGYDDTWRVDGGVLSTATTTAHGTYSQLISGSAGDGIFNRGLNKWGIGVDAATPMQGYVYLKGTATKAVVALQSADGTREYCRQEIGGIGGMWQRYDFSLTPSATDADARFVIALGEDGQLWADMAMLHTASFPFRSDLTQAFKDEHLTFLRYGGTMINAPEYKVAGMSGPHDKRPPYTGHWYQYSTNGFGIREFVEFARLIGTEPTFSVNIEDNPQDVARLLEDMREHNVGYIEIGNEENIGDESMTAYRHYVERLLAFYDMLHPMFSDLKFINAAWWRADKTDVMEYVFRQLDGKAALWDFHPWTDEVGQAKQVEADLKNMKQLFETWNPQTTMRVAILEENGNTHNMHRALSHAIVLNVVRRMNGFVELDSPANALQPYLQNDNGWDQGQIFFDSHSTWCQPPYYVQQMAATHHQPLLVESKCSNRNLNITATRSDSGDKVVLHIVNTSSAKVSVKVSVAGMETPSSVKALTISGALTDSNTPQNPVKVGPVEVPLTQPQMQLPVKSYTVMELTAGQPTAISGVTAGEPSSATVLYNISGQRTTASQRGLVITAQGKKKMVW